MAGTEMTSGELASPSVSREEFTALLAEDFERRSSFEKCLVRGTVMAVENNMALIDVGLKSEGYVPLQEFTALGHDEVEVGDSIEVFVEHMEGKNGEVVLSFEKARREAVWGSLEESFKKNELVQGRIMARVKGGFTVDLFGAPAFLPGSQVDVRPVRDVGVLLEVKQPFQILKMDYRRGNIVVSRRAVLEESRAAERDKLFETLAEGQVITGVVKNLTDYGAFIDLGGVDGLLHITDMAWHRVGHPSEALQIGQSLEVKIIRFKPEAGRISLGMKQLLPDPWEGIERKYPPQTKLKARVTNIAEYGAFVELEPGVEGLVHVSEMLWTKRHTHPSKVVSQSEEVEVMVLQVDRERRRISLGMKQCLDNPWQAFADSHKVNDIVKGVVAKADADKMIVTLSDDLSGVIMADNYGWDDSAPSAEKGEEVTAKILAIDPTKEFIALGIKQMSDDPFAQSVSKITKGQILTCLIATITDKGLDVDLPDGGKGFIRKSSLSSVRDERSTSRFAVGERVDAMVTKVSIQDRQVDLSIKAYEEEEDKKAVAQYGAADSGARLGDILGPAFQKAKEGKATESFAQGLSLDKSEDKNIEDKDLKEASDKAEDKVSKKKAAAPAKIKVSAKAEDQGDKPVTETKVDPESKVNIDAKSEGA